MTVFLLWTHFLNSLTFLTKPTWKFRHSHSQWLPLILILASLLHSIFLLNASLCMPWINITVSVFPFNSSIMLCPNLAKPKTCLHCASLLYFLNPRRQSSLILPLQPVTTPFFCFQEIPLIFNFHVLYGFIYHLHIISLEDLHCWNWNRGWDTPS